MDEHYFFRREPFRECDERFTRCMRAELKLFDVTAHALRCCARIKRHLIVRQRVSQNPSGRFRISVTDKENGMPWLIDDSLRENVGERFRRHHSARERVYAASACSCVVNSLGVQDKWAKFVEQLQTRKMAATHSRAPIINVADFCAESADVDREIENFFPAQFVEHRQHFLRLSEREHGNKDATSARERVLDRLREALFFARARPRRRSRCIAASAFHHQDVDLLLRKNRGLRDRLVIKVNVTCVKQSASFSANENSSGTEYVSGVEEFECNCVTVCIRRSLPCKRVRLSQRA